MVEVPDSRFAVTPCTMSLLRLGGSEKSRLLNVSGSVSSGQIRILNIPGIKYAEEGAGVWRIFPAQCDCWSAEDLPAELWHLRGDW